MLRSDDRDLAERGFVTLRWLLPTPYTRALQRYVRERVEEGYLPLGDAQSPRRYVAHNDAVAAWLHRVLLPALQPFVDRPMRTSYSYLTAYLGGADLPWHTDRAQCEYTLSLTADSTPEEGRDTAWPLHLAPLRGPSAAVLLAPGDGVLFKGRELAHHRDPLPVGHTSTSLLLHYVDEDFDGPLD